MATTWMAAEAATGWLVPPGDARALAGALEEALALTGADRAAIGARARANVTSRFTLAAMQENTLAVYDSLPGTTLAQAFSNHIVHGTKLTGPQAAS